uniref:Uncharacterized protein n=1 Tax=Arundo donax TaxID=35708 RepID=A0A0A9E2C2_ARUDO
MSASPAPPHSAAKLRRLPTTDWLRIEQRHGRAELRLSFTASPPPTNRHLYLPPPPHPPPVQRHPSVCHLHPARLLDFSRPMATSPTQLPSRRSPCTMLSPAMPTPHQLATSLVCTSGLTSLALSLPSSCPLRHSLMLSSPRASCFLLPELSAAKVLEDGLMMFLFLAVDLGA